MPQNVCHQGDFFGPWDDTTFSSFAATKGVGSNQVVPLAPGVIRSTFSE